jgi:uncharacterized membrane protein
MRPEGLLAVFGFFLLLIRVVSLTRENHQQTNKQTNLVAFAVLFSLVAFKFAFARSTAARVSPLVFFFFN